MAEPVSDPETGGRSLADILREAGIENPSRSGRKRRWDDVDDDGLGQRRVDAPAETSAPRPHYGRRATDLPLDGSAPDPRAVPGERRRSGRRSRFDDDPPVARDRLAQDRAVGPDPVTAAIPGLRPSRTPGVPGSVAPPETELPDRRRGRGGRGSPDGRVPRDDGREHERPSDERRGDERRGDRRRSDEPQADQPHGAERRGSDRRQRSQPTDAGPSTGRIPGLTVGGGKPAEDPRDLTDDLDAEQGGRALAWLRFAGELVIAAAAGVGVYFAFGVLWQTFPLVAVLAAPLAVTGLVTGVHAWRQRMHRGAIGAPLLGVLVFAGTLLTVLPAAGLLSGS